MTDAERRALFFTSILAVTSWCTSIGFWLGPAIGFGLYGGFWSLVWFVVLCAVTKKEKEIDE